MKQLSSMQSHAWKVEYDFTDLKLLKKDSISFLAYFSKASDLVGLLEYLNNTLKKRRCAPTNTPRTSTTPPHHAFVDASHAVPPPREPDTCKPSSGQHTKRAILLMLNPGAFIECIMHTSYRFFHVLGGPSIPH